MRFLKLSDTREKDTFGESSSSPCEAGRVGNLDRHFARVPIGMACASRRSREEAPTRIEYVPVRTRHPFCPVSHTASDRAGAATVTRLLCPASGRPCLADDQFARGAPGRDGADEHDGVDLTAYAPRLLELIRAGESYVTTGDNDELVGKLGDAVLEVIAGTLVDYLRVLLQTIREADSTPK